MARFKLARGKAKKPTTRGAVPCIILMLAAMALLLLVFYSILKPG